MSEQGWGTPRYGNDLAFSKLIRLKQTKPGEPPAVLEARILPPMKKQQHKGTWKVYKGQHYGYKVPSTRERDNPDKAYNRTFLCIQEQDFNTKMVTRRCGECESIEKMRTRQKAMMAEAMGKFKLQGMDDKAAEQAAKEDGKELADWLRQHNCDRKWHIHVKTASGEFATLLLSNDDKKALEMQMDKLKKTTGIDPIMPHEGVWWVFTTQGEGWGANKRKCIIDWKTETVRTQDGRPAEMVKLAPLTQADFEEATRILPDLSETVPEISSEQIDALVSCSCDPFEVERIMGISHTARNEVTESRTVTPKVETPAAVVRAAPTPPPQSFTASAQPEQVDEEAELMRKLEALKARKAEAAKVMPPAPPPVAVNPEVPNLASLSDDEFKKLFGKRA